MATLPTAPVVESLNTTSNVVAQTQGGKCPVDHQAFSQEESQQKTALHPETSTVPIERDEEGVWHVRGFAEMRAILRNTDTRQAGFNADQVTNIPSMINRPILYLEGKTHQVQRKQTARFFAPKTVSEQYRDFMESYADDLIAKFKRNKGGDLSQISLKLAMAVVARVVGLVNSRLPGMDKRLEAFFESPMQIRWKWLSDLIQNARQRHMLAFFFLDVQPAITARKRQPQDDLITYLLESKYSEVEILTECVMYAAAGMVTTREFVSVAAWHFLENSQLRDRYLVAGEDERYSILHEMLRLEPVVANLYRRATADITLESEGKSITIREGDKIDLHVYAANADRRVVGDSPLSICPARPLEGEHVQEMVMSFGDGHHRCAGAYLAIQETDIFLQRLLAIKSLRLVNQPSIGWNEIAKSYEIRDFMLAID